MLWLTLFSPLFAALNANDAPENYALTTYDVFSGLPSSVATFVAQTPDGYLWIGTEAGLARFDGARFTAFRVTHTPELGANLVRSVLAGKDGSLWIATQGGLCRYRDGKFEQIGLAGVPCVSLAQDQSDSIWVGTEGRGFWEYRQGGLISHKDDPGMPASKGEGLNLVFGLSDGRVVLLVDGILYSWRDGSIGRFEPTANISGIKVFVEQNPGTYWVAGTHGLTRVRNGQQRSFSLGEGAPVESTYSLNIDRKRRLWVSASGLFRFDEASGRFLRVEIPGTSNFRKLFEDREGNYWVCSTGAGIVKIRPSAFRMVSAEDGIVGRNTRTVAVAADGALWAGMDVTGAARLAPDGSTQEVPTGPRPNGEVWSVCAASDGTVWLGTRGGLMAWRNGRVTEYKQFLRVRALFEDRAGAIWIGSENLGVTRYAKGAFESLLPAIQAKEAPPWNTHVPVGMAFAQDAAGTIYIGLRETAGLARFTETSLEIEHGPAVIEIRAIYPDADGNVWIGGKGSGLFVYRPGKPAERIFWSDTFDDRISAIVEDRGHRIWIGTSLGIMWAPKSELLSRARGEAGDLTLRLAHAADGIRPASVGAGSFPTSALAPDGRIYFGTPRGLAVVDPDALTTNPVVPLVHIESVVVDGKTVSGRDTLSLPPGTRTVAIDYTAPSFVAPSEVRFRYQLEGRDEKWIEAGPRRTALYADLRPGKYTFRVTGCNDDGVWSPTGATFSLIQQPYFYQTAWFYTVVALTFLGLGVGIHRRRTARLHARNAELEAKIALRTAELATSYEATRASEYFYHSLVESLPQIIVRKDADGRITYANTAFAEFAGRPLAEIVGRTDAEIFPPEVAAQSRANDVRVMADGKPLEHEHVVELPGNERRFLHVKTVPLHDRERGSLGVQVLYWDTTSFREVQERLKQAQNELLEASRLAGIAEMATGILHNLGNALTTVNTTTTLALSRAQRSKVGSFVAAVRLLAEHQERLAEFLSQDERGKKLPSFLQQLAERLTHERDGLVRDLQSLQVNVDHIKQLVAAQQDLARPGGVVETVPAIDLLEGALRISESSLVAANIAVNRDFKTTPMVSVERHKVLQIVGNLIKNAKDSLEASDVVEKRIVVTVAMSAGQSVEVSISDNGVGIPPDGITRIFAAGYTTKKNGHGFGLHSSALLAKELGGSLRAQSDGVGTGATFILELPVAAVARRQQSTPVPGSEIPGPLQQRMTQAPLA